MEHGAHEMLNRPAFSILLALSLRPRHGYELMQQIALDSGGRIKLGPGALYSTIRRLSEQNMVEEIPFMDDTNRRYYRLTKKGWQRLGAEMTYYQDTLALAQQRRVFSAVLGEMG